MGHNVSSTKNSVQIISQPNVDASNVNNVNINKWKEKESRKNVFKSYLQRNVKSPDDRRICDISGCYVSKQSVIVVTDFTNKKLKKCNKKHAVICLDLPCSPTDLCDIADNTNEVVVCGEQMLCFVDISGKMKITRTINMSHKCHGIACHKNELYIVDDNTVYVYTLNDDVERTLFKHDSAATRFCHIKLNDKGSLIYISDEVSGVYTVHSSGNLVSVYYDDELKEAQGVCVLDNGHVLVSGFQSDNVIEVDENGGKKIQTVIQDDGLITDPKCLYFNRQTNELYVGQWNDMISIFKL